MDTNYNPTFEETIAAMKETGIEPMFETDEEYLEQLDDVLVL